MRSPLRRDKIRSVETEREAAPVEIRTVVRVVASAVWNVLVAANVNALFIEVNNGGLDRSEFVGEI